MLPPSAAAVPVGPGVGALAIGALAVGALAVGTPPPPGASHAPIPSPSASESAARESAARESAAKGTILMAALYPRAARKESGGSPHTNHPVGGREPGRERASWQRR